MVCPSSPFKVFRRRWSVLIIEELYDSPESGFNFLLTKIKNITPKVLSRNLQELEREMFLEKTTISNSPFRVSYHLTEKGKVLKSIIVKVKELADTDPTKHLKCEGRNCSTCLSYPVFLEER